MSDQDLDAELKAIATLLAALEPLSHDARLNVLAYVFRRLSIDFTVPNARASARSRAELEAHHAGFDPDAGGVIDIRSFKEEKQPKTASEMVAVAAYYLAHLAPLDERLDYILADA